VATAVLPSVREEVRGSSAAKEALRQAVERLNTDRLKSVDKRLVEGEPAAALLEAANNPNTDLIVVGNRGLGAMGESLLGSVPGEVVSQAGCDVLIVQTGFGQVAKDAGTA
jgi:maltose/moltooligosaccharide transporter